MEGNPDPQITSPCDRQEFSDQDAWVNAYAPRHKQVFAKARLGDHVMPPHRHQSIWRVNVAPSPQTLIITLKNHTTLSLKVLVKRLVER
jgi:hypothetical protein